MVPQPGAPAHSICSDPMPPTPLMPQQNTWMIPSSQTTPVSPIPPVTPVLPMPPYDLPTYQKFVSLQNSCPSVKWMETSKALKVVSIPVQGLLLLCDIFTGPPRPLVPDAIRYEFFLSLHQVSHPGICGTRRILSSSFVWPSLSKDVSVWTRACLSCQKNKIHSHVYSPVLNILVPFRRPHRPGWSSSSLPRIHISSYHDGQNNGQSNGLVERFHLSLKSALKSIDNPYSWFSNLPLALLGLRSLPKEDTGYSTSEAIYQENFWTPASSNHQVFWRR